ncbi:MAG: hypothetical protein GXP26_08785 [Planctomycetes bacterium]|nr:hypothetical protein [Planctomycetota bacterium]
MQSQHTTNSKFVWPTKGLLLLLVVFCGTGATCSRSFRNPFASLGPPAPEVLPLGASLEQIIAAVNQNSGRVQSYQTNNASITVPGMPAIPLLRGNIAVQKPGRLRLQASTALTGAEVDLGSNEELFWFWVKRNEPPALYFARHNQFAGSSAQQMLPIDPQWLINAVGLSRFSPTDRHEPPVQRGDGTVEIRSQIQTRAGTMTKNTVVDARRAWILEQHIYNNQGTLVASSRALSHRYYPTMGVSLPQQIELNLPAAQLALTIDVGAVILNQAGSSPELWRLPAISGYPQVDLGTALPGTVFGTGTVAPIPTNVVPQVPPGQTVTPPPVTLPLSQFNPTHTSAFQQPMAHQLPPGGIPANAGQVR